MAKAKELRNSKYFSAIFFQSLWKAQKEEFRSLSGFKLNGSQNAFRVFTSLKIYGI